MNEDAVLIYIQNEKDEDGFAQQTEERIPIFVKEKGVTRAEFYEALRSNVEVKTVLETRLEDWELSAHMVGKRKEYASQVEYDGSVYDIVRTYREGNFLIEIVCK